MDEQAYLKRLRSIRQKYGCKETFHYNACNTEPFYTQPDYVNPERHHNFIWNQPKTNEQKFIYQNPSTKTLLEYENERPMLSNFRSQLRQQRSFSTSERLKLIDDSRSKYEDKSRYQITEAQVKRQQNFCHFIDDLDERIKEKEKLISQRLKDNARLVKPQQPPLTLQPRQMQRYNSQTILRNTQNFIPSGSKQFVKNIYEKKSPLKGKYTSNNSNRQNQSVLKLHSSPAISKNRQYSNIARQTPQKLLASPAKLLENKLGGNLALNRDGWNPQKLQNIQNRIKSVLKHCNN